MVGEGALGVRDPAVVEEWAELLLDFGEEELDGEVAPLLVAFGAEIGGEADYRVFLLFAVEFVGHRRLLAGRRDQGVNVASVSGSARWWMARTGVTSTTRTAERCFGSGYATAQ